MELVLIPWLDRRPAGHGGAHWQANRRLHDDISWAFLSGAVSMHDDAPPARPPGAPDSDALKL